ncbi:MAG: metal-dependent hydrolase [Candidatus Aminicenantes bacterium]|nr:metal-dependent hydrolase [Candidatus Aminicenantes bacterium]
MPLPIGHGLAGIAFFQARPGLFLTKKWLDALFLVFLSNLPDADFLPGLMTGSPNRYHHGIFHSLGAALVVSAVIVLIFFRKKQQPKILFAVSFLVYSSHLLLDFFTRDFAAPYGLPLFWPFSKSYYIAARPIFSNITRSSRSSDFFPSLFNSHNLKAALLEIVLIGGLVLMATMVRFLLTKGNPRSNPG